MEQLSEKPLDIPVEQINTLYRFSSNLEEVNWEAKYRSNLAYLARLVPYLHGFLNQNIRKITGFNT